MAPIPKGNRPSVGRIVHYNVGHGIVRAALIVAVHEGDQWSRVDLAVFEVPASMPNYRDGGQPAPITTELNVPRGEVRGTWAWPVLLA